MASLEAAPFEFAEEVIAPTGGSDAEDCNSRVILRKCSDSPLLVSNKTDYFSEITEDDCEIVESPVKKRKQTRKRRQKHVLFSKGCILAVRSEEDEFWLCQTKQNVYETSKKFAIRWLNKDSGTNGYVLGSLDTTELECVITDVELERKVVYSIGESEKKRIVTALKCSTITTDADTN